MRKIVVSFLGHDCPGVLHSVAGLLSGLDCNIEEITQTILQGEFAMILIAELPEGLGCDEVQKKLSSGLGDFDMNFTLREVGVVEGDEVAEAEPFVVTLSGPDRKGVFAGIGGVLARFDVNIENLKALPRQGEKADELIVGFEISLPVAVDLPEFRSALAAEAGRLGMDVSLQHREIFEAMHRVQPL